MLKLQRKVTDSSHLTACYSLSPTTSLYLYLQTTLCRQIEVKTPRKTFLSSAKTMNVLPVWNVVVCSVPVTMATAAAAREVCAKHWLEGWDSRANERVCAHCEGRTISYYGNIYPRLLTHSRTHTHTHIHIYVCMYINHIYVCVFMSSATKTW